MAPKIKDIRPGQAKKVRAYVENAQRTVAKMNIHPRAAYKHPFDIVGLAIVTKIFALTNACLELLGSGFADEAFGLSRSVVECVTNLRYMTAEPNLQDSRTRDFVNYALADKAYWAHYALEQFKGQPEENEIRKYARELGVTPDTKPARRHWSGLTAFVWDVVNINHPLDGSTTEQLKKMSYAADYFHASAFVHCSSPAIDNYFVEDMTPFKGVAGSRVLNTGESTLRVLLVYLHNSLAYAFFGMQLERPDSLDPVFNKALKALKP